MQKDLKIGMLLGTVLVTVVMVWLSTGSSLRPKAGRPDPRSNLPPLEDTTKPHNFSTNGLTVQTAEDNQSKPPDSTIYSAGHPTVGKTEKIKTQKFHIISKGETLSDISYKYYGSANKWQKILDVNRDAIEDVSKLKPGTKLIIPE